jgi:hypothetical protein
MEEKPTLPEGWDLRIDDQNRFFYVDTYARGKEKRCFWHPPKEEEDHDDIPGWKRVCTVFGRVYWVHDKSKIISYENPRYALRLRHKPSGKLSVWFQSSWWDRRSVDLTKFCLDDSEVACQISKSVWRKGISKRAVILRGDLWWGNLSVNEQNLKLTHVKKESHVFLYSEDEASSEDEAEPDMGPEDPVSIPLTRESVLASKDSPERGVSMPHSLPNNYVRPYVEDGSDHDDGVEPKVSIL